MHIDTKTAFSELFGGESTVHAFAPGRVNLIGEHTDYNGGYVMPCALDLGIEGAARLRDDNIIRLYSANFPDAGVKELTLDFSLDGGWTDYPLGVIKAFAAMGYNIDRGADIVFSGSLPDGSGLSSSAALEVLTGILLRELYSFPVTAQEIAVFGQFAENRFIGVNCGIMDQFASAMGKSGCAVLLDSSSLSYSYAPFPDEDAAIILVNSGVKHSLAASAYNDRRRECESALADINHVRKLRSLCALGTEEFEEYMGSIKDPVCRKRACHAVSENARTIAAAKALNNGDLALFGRLTKESHLSLQNDFEVSCEELDFLAHTAWELDGVYGGRMTGGGFGGCTVNIVRRDCAESFIETIKAKYNEKYGKVPAVYTVKIGSGASVL